MRIAQIHKNKVHFISMYGLLLPNNVMQLKGLARLDHAFYRIKFVSSKKKPNKSCCDAVFFLILLRMIIK